MWWAGSSVREREREWESNYHSNQACFWQFFITFPTKRDIIARWHEGWMRKRKKFKSEKNLWQWNHIAPYARSLHPLVSIRALIINYTTNQIVKGRVTNFPFRHQTSRSVVVVINPKTHVQLFSLSVVVTTSPLTTWTRSLPGNLTTSK